MSEFDNSKLRRLDGTLLLVFQGLMRERRATLVGERLCLSPSAVSHSLARLRELFDDPLFERRPHGLEPTPHALELAPLVDALLENAHHALGLGARFDPLETERGFRIACSDFITALVAPSLLDAFTREAPKARFAFRMLLGEQALRALRRNEIDIAIGQFGEALEGLATTWLFGDSYCVTGRRQHPKLQARLTRQTLEGLDHVAASIAGDFTDLKPGGVNDIGIKRRVVATVPRFLLGFMLVGCSDKVMLAPRRLVERCADAFGLQAHDIPAGVAVPESPQWWAVRRQTCDAGVLWLEALLQGLDLRAQGIADRGSMQAE
ncbi:LysR family transcriptional regulator [Aquabacterium sp. A7-Y]|uniref:LysR family transcriptional regulator n=1 Tax=Aquabacterium sp. A7-Y TaxID=1349605 RepID=UPI00223D36FE|nr:LysR family transcriptional regulator [Aquabacterium sp. A7-Y]MCW7536957.1 LysR family transcriptional regulator [Aquabacterium sp. A7-Y]